MRRIGVLRELRLALRFLTVGGLATGLHMGVSLGLALLGGAPEQTANLGAFLCAMGVSFLGNYHWTFASTRSYARSLPRFLIVACTGFAASAVLIDLLAGVPGLAAPARLILGALAIPAITFLASRIWVY